MNQHLCNNCGGAYEYRHGRWVCRACGAFKPESISNEEVTLLYTAYQKLRLAEFDEAEKEFDDILRKYPRNPNAYWGRLMAKYGIKYEEDFDGRMIPTCYATSIESVISASDYKKSLEYADEDARKYYREQAEYVERVRREWVEKASKEKPYDIFICYKDSDLENDIERTQDSIAAQDLYIHLTNKGYRVFFSHESLRDKVGEKYEPYIFNALATSKVMIVYGSKPEYITSTWLKNEWTRYEKRIQSGEKKHDSLLVACEGFSPAELPHALSSRQCLNANEKSFYSDLDESIERILRPEQKGAGQETSKEKKKSKAPLFVTLLLLLALAVGIFARYATNGEETVTSTTNSSYSATAVIGEGGFPKGTEFRVKEIARNASLQTLAATLPVNQDTYHLYDMELWCDGAELDLNTNVTVTLPLLEEISEERAVVYYMSESQPQKMSAQTSQGKISFVTNHFSIYMIAEELSDCNHRSVTDAAVAPTCTEEGLTEGAHCSLCGEILTAQEALAPLGHKPDQNATCTEPSNCSVCGERLESSGGHIPGNPATCTSAQTCIVCNAEITPATGHDHKPTVTASTCTTPGSTKYACACGDSYIDGYVAPLGHKPGENATCTESSSCSVCGQLMVTEGGHLPGNKATCTSAQTCAVCGIELAPATGHDHKPTVTAPTCTTPGSTKYACACGDSYIDGYVAPLGHKPNENATCTESSSCSVCGQLMVTEGGHLPGNQATCTSAQICAVCGIELAPMLDHDYGATVTAPTCTENGYTTYICVCGDSYIGNTVEALGHTPSEDATCTEPSNCAVCGELLENAGGHTPGKAATCLTAQTCVVCGTELAPATGHNHKATVTAPTCTASGYTTYTCACGNSYIADYVDIIQHTPDREATCTESSSCSMCGQLLVSASGHIPGNRATCTSAQTCVTCGEELSPKLDHNYEEKFVEDPNHENGGYTVYTCTLCGHSYNSNQHDHIYQTKVTKPTCEEEGYTTYTCTICGDTFDDDYTDMLDCVYDNGVITEPTCTEDGYTTYTCINCDDSYDGDYVDALGHTPAMAPTCSEEQYCSVCYDYLDPELDHQYETEVTEPTCTEQGYTTYTCTVCGDTFDDDYTDMLDCVYDNGVITEPTCEDEGYTTYTCINCDDSYDGDYVDALGHSYDAYDDGYSITYTCSECGDSYSDDYYVEEDPCAYGHNYAETDYSEPDCTSDGYTTYTCTECGDSYDETESSYGHNYVETDYSEPDCTSDGYTTYTCTECGDSYDETESSYGHSYDSYDDGYSITYTCSDCGDSYSEDYYYPEEDYEEDPCAYGHSYDSYDDGYSITYTCTYCGDSYSEDYYYPEEEEEW